MIDQTFLTLQARVAGRFSLEREIGRGGMGVVYLARDVALERPVAIKVLDPALGARREMRERFLREARIAAQCFHPHIVPIHAVEEADGLAWIVMAYVRGETLADRLRRTGPLDADELRRLAREVGWALAYAHQRGVVHRDIKPENLLIDASTGRYVIADFGIAQVHDQHRTPADGSFIGTARYMAPEQALGEAIDGRADLYALGVTLFVAATGRLPFDGGSSIALIAKHAAQPAPSVRAFAPALPLNLARAVDRCLAKQPVDRFADAGHFLAAIEPDVREHPLALALHAARDHAVAARRMCGLSAVSGLTTIMLVLGERPDSLGRSIVGTIGGGVSALFAAAMVMRSVEALIEARRLLRQGQAANDVARALAGDPPSAEAERNLASRSGTALAILGSGLALAFAQGRLSSTQLPYDLQEWIQLLSLFLPPMLIARGGNLLARSAGVGRWVHARITAPLAALAARRLSRGRVNHDTAPALADAPTEMLLVRAVASAIGALPPAQRDVVGSAHALAHKLAQEAAGLRGTMRALDAREAGALVLRESIERADALDAVRQARESVQARLQTTIAALESIRLDVLRFTADRSDGGLTAQLDEVREVQRRVDAVVDVRRLLRELTPT